MADEIDIHSPTGANIYALIYRISDGKVADVTNSTFDTYAVADLGDYDLALTEASTASGYYAADFPTWISAGDYRVVYKLRAGASPAASDVTLSQEQFYWNGSTVTSSPSSDYLTTLTRVKAHLGISSTTYDTVLTSKLSAASRFIESYCDRLFLSETRTDYCNGRGTDWLQLRLFPITAVTRIATCPETVMLIRNSDAVTNQRANAFVSSTNLTLTRVASAATTTTNLALATYTTLTTLAAAVDAVGSGWDASLPTARGNWQSADLRATQGTKDAINGDAELEMFTEVLGCGGTNPDTGTVYGYFPHGYQNIEVKYTGGYASGAVPDPVQEACCSIVAALFNMSSASGPGGTAGLKSETIGDYKYENFDMTTTTMASTSVIQQFAPDALMLLAAYRLPGML